MTNDSCPMFAYHVTGRKVWAPWATETTTVLACDAWRAAQTAAERPNFKGCKMTRIERW